ncbi:hypothetical protein [Paraburkholderia sp. 22B1P]|uniref:hypothetical protein n=1 Tax=Paraburkholderia sp. 22B1P TaxID=3080498 RepID=UPI00308E1D0C|nr:phage tail protein [Paraburkholderia sp. 22B1P]
MPIPNSINDLDVNPNNNSPQGSETVGPNANGYLQALGAFIKQIATGVGFAPTSDVNMGGKKLTNLGAGSTTSTSTDAITGAQARALAYKVGEQRMWHGAVANIATVWGPGWQLADGTNGTANCVDRFIVGAGNLYAPGATGGNSTNVLTTAQLPAHNHGVTDPGHTHTVNDPGHGHSINDPGHQHAGPGGVGFFVNTAGVGNYSGGPNQFTSTPLTGATQTGIGVNASASNVSVNGVTTGITTQNTGTGTAVENKPPYYASCILEYTGIGA